MTHRNTRRNFLLTSLAAAGGFVGVSACRETSTTSATPVVPVAQTPESAPTVPPPAARTLPVRPLGQTGVTVPLLGLGGSASPLSRPNEEDKAVAIIERALELGVRYFDTAANYGPSEEFLGKVLPPHRAEIFIATKTGHRDRNGAQRELEQSLKRLQTDHIDLWQFHGLTHDWDLDTLLNERTGAIRAALEAKEQGLIKHIGVTGHHNPDIIVKALQRYPFDTALVPINAADKHTAKPFISNVLPVAQQKNVGIIAMKVPAYGRLFKPGVLTGMSEAMGYALSQAGVSTCIIAAETIANLEENVTVAQQFQPLAGEALASIEQRTAAVWEDNSFFRNWA
ncbi:MAG TPA: aldo/keto reductase [Trichocoleus sp.]